MSSSARLRLSSLDAGLRRAHLASRLRSATPSELLPDLERVLREDTTEARSTLLDLAEVLGRDAALREKVAVAAREQGSLSLSRWLQTKVEITAQREPSLRDKSGRLLTLGEKKTLARLAPAELLPKLLLDVEVSVVARALSHPRLTEDLLVTVMAKRPGSPLLLIEVSKHAKWVQRARVRVALLAHPDTPAVRALLLVPLLLRQELELVVTLPRVPPEVREAARVRLAGLPPLPPPPDADA